ncbi:MAG: type II secretion system protein N [Gammaproteobacteria bacterium]|nr:type II secretion system protein N [Gammaproteobacteria bacterium]
MSKKYYILTAIFSYLILLFATIPAKPIVNIINDNSAITLHGVSGTLWSGNAYIININNKAQLKDTEWSFKPWKLLLGEIAIDIDTQYSNHDIKTELGTSFLGTYFINGLIAQISADDAAQLANIPLVQVSGLISLDIENARWKRGELPTAIGSIDWKNAVVTVADSASLGNVKILLGESEQQLLSADIKNQGGDIKISGTAELAPEANYIVSIKLSPTASANNSIKQSLGLFAEKQNNGEYLFKDSGSLSQIGLI